MQRGLFMGINIGDELLGCGAQVSALEEIFRLCKAVWPAGIVYYNEEWAPVNDPAWHDKSGEPFWHTLPAELDWISFDWYSFHNISWLQPMCEYPQNLYPKMNANQRAVLLPGAFGSTSGPRGGQSWTVQTYSQWVNSSDPDPFSCANIGLAKDNATYVDPREGLVFEVDQLLTQIGGRPCWKLEDYDSWNALQAQKYYEWAVADPRVIGIVIFPWGGAQKYLPLDGGAYVGLNVMLGPELQPNATATWAAIGQKIRNGQQLPAVGVNSDSEALPPPHTGTDDDESLPADLDKAHEIIRNLRAQIRALKADDGATIEVAAVLTKAQYGGNAWKCNWTETTGVEYCNGDNWLTWPTPDPFGAGKLPGYPECAMLPANWSLGRVVAACEQLCASADECIGFTLNPSAAQGGNPAGKTLTSCCFRAGEITSSPACGSSACKGVRCYQKKGCPTEKWVTVAVGRRPYVNERYGHVLLSSSFPAGPSTICSVAASVGGRVISNGSWTWDIRSHAVAKYEFDLSLLPISLEAVLNTTIRCDSLGWSAVKFRDFQRYPANSAPSSLSQVDHESRSILVGGRKFLMVGWYWSMNDNTVTNYTAYVVEQARLGVTVLMPYNFPLLMLHGRAALQKEILDACDATGMKLIMHVESLATAAAAANTSMAWSNLTAVINAIKDHPAVLGYYICDDCCDSQYQDVLSWVYRALKALDPYHITIGALNDPCFLQYTDGENNDGKLAIDLSMYENYGNGDDKSLHTHTSPKAFENTARSWPMFWEPITNCPWAESSNEKLAPRYPGPVYSPLNVRSVAYAGLIGNASLPNLLFFDYFAGTEDALKQVVARIALEMQDLKPSLLPSVTAQQPSVRAFNPSLRARAFGEDVVGSTEVCIHVIVLNTDNAFEAVQLEIAFRGLPSNIEAVLPFEGNADRRVPVVNGLLNDTAAPNSVNIYRIGCSVAAPDDANLSPNPSFEEPFLLGGITAWSGGRAGWWGDDGHDSRARLYTDTSDPQHGRYSLRINVPSHSAAGLTVPWAQDCSPHCNADSDGFRLAANTSYTIQLWARSEPPGMDLQVVAGAWALDQAECNAFHVAGQYLRNQTLGGRTLNSSWGRITVVYKAAPQDQHLQLQILSGRGSVFIDNTFIGTRPAGGHDGQLAETRLAWAGNSRARED